MTSSNGTVLFYHHRASETLLQKYSGAELVCVDMVKPEMLEGREKQTLVFVLANNQLGRVTELCRQAGVRDVYAAAADGFNACDPIRIDVAKPRLDYLETELTTRCNLHCRGCANFVQLAEKERPFYDLQNYIRDIERLKELFWGIEKIRLMGGEPLLVKNIADFAEQTRRVFPDTDLRIVTNGLLIPSLPRETLSRLKACGCSFDISNYRPTARRKHEILSVLRNAGIPYDFGFPMRYFLKNVSEKPSGDQKSAFDNCMFTHCHMLSEGGILTPCSFAFCIRRFNRHYGTDYPETDFVNLHKTKLDGWEILEWMSNPHLFCGCCTSGMVPVRWRDGVHAADAREGDWIIPKNVCTDYIVPFVQRMLMPAAKAMRSFIQGNQK